MTWCIGEPIVRREVWQGRPWRYLPQGASFVFPTGAGIRVDGERIGAMLDAGRRWWDESCSRCKPPADSIASPLPVGWDVV